MGCCFFKLVACMYCIFVCVFIAEITFSKRGDAKKALDKYNGVHLDGAKMKIQFVQGQSISERVVLPKRPLQVALSLTRIKLKGSSLSCFRTYVQFSYIYICTCNCNLFSSKGLLVGTFLEDIKVLVSKVINNNSSSSTASNGTAIPSAHSKERREDGQIR